MTRVLAVLAVLASCCQSSSQPRSAGFPAVREDRVLAPGATDRHAITLARGESCAIVVTQLGVDVVVEAFGPDGGKLATVDSPNGREGDEPVEIIATTAGTYRIDVHALEPAQTGRYTIALVERRDVARTRTVLAERARAREAATAWLRARSGAITLHDAQVDGAGLDRFDAVAKQARIVGIGEATHGSRQFADIRLALTRRLVERHGVRVIGLEASAARMRRVDAWTRDGNGDLASIIGTGWINNRAFTALATEIRAWNKAHPNDPVTIVGLDDQDNAPARELVARVVRQGPDVPAANQLDAVLARLAKADAQALVFGRSDVTAADWQYLLALVARLEAQRAPREAIAAARTLAQAAELNTGAPNAHSRDYFMAANLEAALGAGVRGALWAHNAHVGHPPDRSGHRATTGNILAEERGYAAFALAFRRGGFVAQVTGDPQNRLQTFELPDAGAETIDGVLAPLGTAIVTWLDDITTAPPWLRETQPMHWIGALFASSLVPEQWFHGAKLLGEYDGVVTFDRVDAEAPPH